MTATPLPMAVSESLAFRSHCPFCAYQCGIRFGDQHGPVEQRIQGDPHFPVNNGQLCIKGWTSFALLGHPKRLTLPLVRDSRSEPLREASWDEALDRIATAMMTIREQHGPDANAVFGSGALTNEKAYLLGKFARVALRTANIDYNGRYCMSSAAGGANRAFGVDRGMPFPVSDFADAEVIVLVGSNCADTLPPIQQWFDRQRINGGKTIVIDPRRTPTAKRAGLHLPVTPGTDLALATGLLYLAIEEGFLQADYIASRTTGFDAVRAIALQYYPAHVERLTGVPESLLRQAIRWMGQAKSCLILTGRGPEQQSKGVATVNAWTNLALALGLPGKANSGWGTLTGQGNGQGGREHGQKADQLPGYRLIENEQHRREIAAVWGIEPEDLPRKGKSAFELIDACGAKDGIHSLFLMGSNLAVASPDRNRVIYRLKSLDFLAVCEAFPNETTELADVVLPVMQWAEEEGTLTNFEGRVIHRRPTMYPPTGVRSDIEILCELATRMNARGNWQYDNNAGVFDEFRRATAGGIADYSGITYEKIDENDGVFWPCPAEDHPGTPRLFADCFYHPDGKARFLPVEQIEASDRLSDDYPYLFTTGRYKEHYNSGAQTRMIERIMSQRPIPVLEIHPLTARRHGVRTGDRVTLESPRGRADFRIETTLDIRSDTLFAPFHWGGLGSANALTAGALDPVSRMPEFKLAAVRIVSVQKAGATS